MDEMVMPEGTPWLDSPMTLESGRDYTCKFSNPAYCEYYEYRWRFWYIADLVYALPTVGFFVAVIAFFTVLFALQQLLPARTQEASPMRHINTIQRFLSYRMYRISFLDWNTAPLGVLLLGLLGFLFFFLMVLVPQPYYWPTIDEGIYGNSPALATRSGWLSLACLPFVIATAGKSNLITLFTGVSYERLQVFHRWISYAFFVTALLHTFPFIVFNISQGIMVEQWNASIFYWTGVVALIAQAYLTFASMSPIRNLSYEWFKFSHFVAALVFVLFLFLHCDWTLTSWDYFIATGVLFSLSWLHRQIKTYFENGIRHKAELSVTSNGFVKVTIPTNVRWTAGQHFFVRFFGLGMHTLAMHPFSACSLPTVTSASNNAKSELVLLIRPYSGFTARLLKYAHQDNTELAVTLDGPYGGIEMQHIEKSDKIVLIAGGSGAGWVLPMVIAYLRRLQYSSPHTHSKTSSTMQVTLSSRDRQTAEWFQRTLEAVIAEHGIDPRTAPILVSLHHTGSLTGYAPTDDEDLEKTARTEVSSTTSLDSLSSRYTHSNQRPDLPAIIEQQVVTTQTDESTAVFVCGPLSMQHDVGNAVAKQQLRTLKSGQGEVTLHMEHFSWA